MRRLVLEQSRRRVAREALLIAVLALAVASCGNKVDNNGETATQGQPLKPFEFRGLKPGLTTVDQAKKQGVVENCTSYDVEKVTTTSCWATKHSIGNIPMGASSVSFDNGVFDWLNLEFATAYFESMVEQTRQVYGEPCGTDSKKLQNAFGAQFDGDEIRWCFAEGTLTVRRHAEDNFRLGEFDYFTSRPEKPAETYNADTL